VDGESADIPPATGHALMVVGATQDATDMEIRTRLERKMPVDVIPETTVTSGDATGKALVVITASASVLTDTKFRDVTVPVLLLEPNLLGLMGMTDVATTAHATTARTETQISIIAPATQPLTAGLTGNVTVYLQPWRVVWGVPAPAAIQVATVLNQPTQIAIFAYPTGAQMVTGTAPAKRLSFFLHNNTVANVTEDGFKLLDAAVDWLLAP
jgi:hypothetical protein